MNSTHIPPFGYRILSRHTVEEIARRSFLSKRTIHRISGLKSWNPVTCGSHISFIYGCGFNPDKPPISRWKKVCQLGISSVKHLSFNSNDEPWQAGVKANRIKSISSVVQ